MQQRHFHAHETARMDELSGLPLATFWQRALGFFIDFVLMLGVWFAVASSWLYFIAHKTHGHTNVDLHWDHHDFGDLFFLLIYAWLFCYFGNGQTPGKRLARTRVVSLTHERLGKWQSFERALGYGASFLEGGFGFFQYFMHRNRQCVHDRIAETIVVDVRKRARRLEEEALETQATSTPSHTAPGSA